MPALHLFGRRWHTASDDLVLPAAIGAFLHCCWTALVAIALGCLEDPEDCDKGRRFLAYFTLLLALYFALTVAQLFLAIYSAKGTILEYWKRDRPVRRLCYCVLLLYVLLIGVNIFGTYAAYAYPSTCFNYTINIDEQSFTLFFIYCTWGLLAIFLWSLMLSWNMYPNVGEFKTWKARTTCFSRLLCCTGLVSGRTDDEEMDQAPLVRIARLFHTMFAHTGLTISDMTTSLILVGVEQRLKRDAARQSTTVCGSSEGTSNQTEARLPLNPPSAVDTRVLHEAVHYMRYACASYGWPMYLWSQRSCLACCTECCCLCASNIQPPQRNSRQPLTSNPPSLFTHSMNYTAIEKTLNVDGTRGTEVIYVNHVNQVEGVLPYIISIHPDRKEVVLAIRGSMSIADVVTDLLCEPALLPENWSKGLEGWQRTSGGGGTPRRPLTLMSLKDGFERASVRSVSTTNGGRLEFNSSEPLPVAEGLEHAAEEYAFTPNPLSSAATANQYAGNNLTEDRQSAEVASRYLEEQIDPTRPPSRHISEPMFSTNPVDGSRGAIRQKRISEGRGADAGDGPRGALSQVRASKSGGLEPAQGTIELEVQATSSTSEHHAESQRAKAASVRSKGSSFATAQPPLVMPGMIRGPSQETPAVQMEERLSVKRSMSVTDSDICTRNALLMTPELKEGEDPAANMVYAHRGMYKCAKAIITDLENHGVLRALLTGDTDVLDKAQRFVGQRQCLGWNLVITGHSLGAGVATLVGLYLKSWYPKVQLWCFAPPAGLLSARVGEDMQSWCTSVIIARDMIPRLSFHSVERLRDDMIRCAALSKVNKTQIWLGAVTGKRWKHHEIFHDELPKDKQMLQSELDAIWRRSAQRATSHTYNSGVDFRPAGRLLYLECRKAIKKGGCCGRKRVEELYNPRWAEWSEIGGLGMQVSRHMFWQHVPDVQMRMMEQALAQLQKSDLQSLLEDPEDGIGMPDPR